MEIVMLMFFLSAQSFDVIVTLISIVTNQNLLCANILAIILEGNKNFRIWLFCNLLFSYSNIMCSLSNYRMIYNHFKIIYAIEKGITLQFTKMEIKSKICR